MTVSACTISVDGALIIAFDDGWTLRCEPDSGYEAWELRTPTEYVVCTPGGGISVWSSETERGQPSPPD